RSVDKTAGTNGEDIYTVNAVGVKEAGTGNKYVKVTGGGTDDFVIDDSALDTAITSISVKASPVQYSNADDPITPNGGTPSNDVTLIGADNTQPVVIHNVGAGYRPTDAVNVSQLQQVAGDLNNRMDGISQHSDASAASAIAVASMPQAYLPGKNLVSIGGGTYHGQTGYAVGISTISDNGSWIFKATATGNSKNRYGGGIGAGFQW
ncbi:MAG: YadA-like family protein, partial [Neisseriaceae bacterium]|nr:YadA-like family protein [Neisseriaceae bacterium]